MGAMCCIDLMESRLGLRRSEAGVLPLRDEVERVRVWERASMLVVLVD